MPVDKGNWRGGLPPRQEDTEESGWLATYGDMMSLLLVFFVLLFAMSTIDVEKFKSVFESVSKALGGKGDFSQLEEQQFQEEGEEELESLNQVYSRIEDVIFKESLQDVVEIEKEARGVILNIKGEALFDSGRATIKPSFVPYLQQVAAIIKSVPNRVVVEGHTDDVPIRTAQFPSNWELSAARAASVVRFMIENADVNPERLSAVGYAEFRPRVPMTPANRAKNRRVEMVISRELFEGAKEVEPVIDEFDEFEF